MTNETTIAILTNARAFIANGWCQGHSAYDADGCPINATSPRAVCFCIYGAFDATGIILEDSVIELFKETNGLPQNKPLSRWNDEPGRTQAEVLEAFDHAIAKAKEVNS